MKQRFSIQSPSSASDRFAVAISDLLGSLWFLGTILVFIAGYIIWNTGIIPGLSVFDPSPFNVLDSILSVFAIILSVSVLISQNRQRRLEKVREEVEFEINIRAEEEITKMLEMLHVIQKKLGIANDDTELEEMKKETDIRKLHENIRRKNR